MSINLRILPLRATSSVLGSTNHGHGTRTFSGVAAGLLSALALVACGPVEDADALTSAATTDLNYYWQPFTTTSVWNLKLPAGRAETAIPAAALKSGPLALSDGTYGINVYFAKASDPLWSLQYNTWASVLGAAGANPAKMRAPVGMSAPGGTDGSIIVIDENLQYGYELWQFRSKGGTSASASSVNVIDLRSAGIKGNIGLSGSGLPGIGGLLKSYETKNNVAIRHKLWLAAHPAMLFPSFVSPATQQDLFQGKGSAAFLKYGDVVALSKAYNVDTGPCSLSPFMKRIAQALQDYGGIIQDQGGDGIGVVAEVDSVRSYIDVDYNSTMWSKLACLQPYLVKVNDPWTGAQAGGLGYGASSDTTAPTTPPAPTATAKSASQIDVRWTAAKDNVGVAGYRVLRNGVAVATATGASFSDSGLAPSTSYRYSVMAFDAAGNQSSASLTASATTTAAATPPAGGGTQLLSNGGMESSLSPWFTQAWDGAPQISLSSSGARSGRGALRIVNPASGSGGIGGQNFSVSGGVKLTVSSYVNMSAAQAGRALLVVDFFDASGKLLGEVLSAGQAAGQSGYNLETLTTTTPSGTKSAGLYLYSAALGTVLFDDASVLR